MFIKFRSFDVHVISYCGTYIVPVCYVPMVVVDIVLVVSQGHEGHTLKLWSVNLHKIYDRHECQ